MIAVRTDDEQKMSSIKSFFANKNVFVTGGTGFLGAVLVESILSTSPDVGNIFLLVRDKYGSNANTRIQRLLAKPVIYNGCHVKDHVEYLDTKLPVTAHSADALKKVVPVIGELSEKNLGIKDDELQRLRDTVNIVYHSAATIKFNVHLKTAITVNLIGTYRTIEFAKSLKKLDSYVYLSTAFCNADQATFIEEKVYTSVQDPYKMMELVDDEQLWTRNSDSEMNALLGGHPNTYTFTKQLAENLLLKEMAGYPAGIVRPSVVYGTYKDPLVGWVGNANSGHLGLLVGYCKGIFRTISGKGDLLIDIIPCDYVINAAITMGWYVGTRKPNTIEVIHSTCGERNPLTLNQFCDTYNENAPKNPCDSIVFIPYAKPRDGLRYELFIILFHLIPAIIATIPETLFQFGRSRKTMMQYMQLFHKGSTVFNYFLHKSLRYSVKNALRIMDELHPDDIDRYQYDAKNCDWSKLIEGCFLGIRRYYFRESYDTTMWHRVMYKLFQILYYVGWVFLLALLYFMVLPLAGTFTLTCAIASSIWLFLIWL